MNGPQWPRSPGRVEYDAELRLLDHQIVGPDEQMLGKVDDMTLVEEGGGLRVGYLLVGPEALGNRLPGKVGSWTLAVWRRLRPDTDPGPISIPLGDVMDVGSAVTVRPRRAHRLEAEFGLEHWLRHFLISRIPGSSNDPGESYHGAHDERPDIELLAQVGGASPTRISMLIGAQVTTSHTAGAAQDDLGRVVDVRLTTRGGHISSGLDIAGIIVSPYQAGATLGYLHNPDQGPAVMGALIRRLHRRSRYIPWSDVQAVDWPGHTLRVSAGPPRARRGERRD